MRADPPSPSSPSSAHASDVRRTVRRERLAALGRHARSYVVIVGALLLGLIVSVFVLAGYLETRAAGDRALWQTWVAHQAEYDCCASAQARTSDTVQRCAPGVAALLQLDKRLSRRSPDDLLERAATALAHLIGATDLALSGNPLSREAVHDDVTRCSER